MRKVRRISIMLAVAFSLCDGDGLMFGQRVVLAHLPIARWALEVAVLFIVSCQLWCQYWLLGRGAQAVPGLIRLVPLVGELICVAQGIMERLQRTLLEHPAIKRGGYGAMVILGLVPIPGFRGPGMTLCRATNWRRGMWVLVIANIARILYMFPLFR